MKEYRLEELAIMVHPSDSVAVAKTLIPEGTLLNFDGRSVRVNGTIKPKHKLVLRDTPQGTPVVMYGEYVGIATMHIKAGDPLTTTNLSSDLTSRREITYASKVKKFEQLAQADIPTFLGIDRGKGGIGTRNHILILYTVVCAKAVAEKIAATTGQAFGYNRTDPYIEYAKSKVTQSLNPVEASRKIFPNVDGIVVLQHESGCGTPNRGDIDVFMDFTSNYIRNPNVGGALVLGLGCEKAKLEWLDKEYLDLVREETAKPIYTLNHQTVGTEDVFTKTGIDLVHRLLTEVNQIQRREFPISELILGTKCGGSDGFSGISANPVLGWASDCIARAGGTVLLPEIPEIFGAEHILAERAVSKEIGEKIIEVVRWHQEYTGRDGVKLAENPSQGNIADGLLTIQMKSLGAIGKSGSSAVSGVLDYAERLDGKGLYVLNTPGYDSIATAALPASGAIVGCFTTGLGTPLGNPIMPVIKMATNTVLYDKMMDLIDFNAGTVIDGIETIEQAGKRLLQKIILVASGELTLNEKHDHRESAFWQRQCTL